MVWLLVILALVLLMLQTRVREHLAPTSTIKAPTATRSGSYNSYYSTADVDAIASVNPAALSRLLTEGFGRHSESDNTQVTPFDRNGVKGAVSDMIAFVYPMYAMADTLPTEADFRLGVSQWLQLLGGGGERIGGLYWNQSIQKALGDIAIAYFRPTAAAGRVVASEYTPGYVEGPAAQTGIAAPGATKGGFYNSRYSESDVEAIAEIVPTAIEELNSTNWGKTTSQGYQKYTRPQLKGQLSNAIAYLYTNVYAANPSAVTVDTVKAGIDAWATSDSEAKASTLSASAKDILTRVGVKYFVPPAAPTGPTGATSPTQATGPTGSSVSQSADEAGFIKIPRANVGRYESTYDDAETRRIVTLSLQAKTIVEEGYAQVTPPNPVTKAQLVAAFLTRIVSDFYTAVYAAGVPVTHDTIRDYVATKYASSGGANRNAYKDLLQKYYIRTGSVQRTDSIFTELDANEDERLTRGEFNEMVTSQTGGTSGAGTTGGDGAGGAVSGEFERSLAEYRTASLNYKLTGNASYKTQADGWKAWIDSQIEDIRSRVSENATYIQQFVKAYENSDQELVTLQSDLRTIRQKGPEAQAIYETEKEAQKQEPLDFSPFYSKAGILTGMLAGVVGLSFFA